MTFINANYSDKSISWNQTDNNSTSYNAQTKMSQSLFNDIAYYDLMDDMQLNGSIFNGAFQNNNSQNNIFSGVSQNSNYGVNNYSEIGNMFNPGGFSSFSDFSIYNNYSDYSSTTQSVQNTNTQYANANNNAANTQYVNSSGEISSKAIEELSAKNGANSDKILAKVEECAAKYDLDPNLILAVMKQESGFVHKSSSSVGAIGFMQLMPGTAQGLGVDPHDMYQNIEGGCKYLKQMLDAQNGDVKLALASYNAGPGNVKKYGGVPPFKETQNYVSSDPKKGVIGKYNEYLAA